MIICKYWSTPSAFVYGHLIHINFHKHKLAVVNNYWLFSGLY
jgi:hypothetical protein